MTRPPKARNVILDAAERIVKERGAANLTYEELVQASGVSRGGITYHFATKDDLLRALIERDIEQWSAQEEQHRARLCQGRGALAGDDLVAFIRSSTEPNPEKRRFVAGMLSAVAHDRSLLTPVREREAQRCPAQWCEAELRRMVLRLAAEGLFWSEIFGCTELPPGVRERVVEQMERLAREWSKPPDGDATSS